MSRSWVRKHASTKTDASKAVYAALVLCKLVK